MPRVPNWVDAADARLFSELTWIILQGLLVEIALLTIGEVIVSFRRSEGSGSRATIMLGFGRARACSAFCFLFSFSLHPHWYLGILVFLTVESPAEGYLHRFRFGQGEPEVHPPRPA